MGARVNRCPGHPGEVGRGKYMKGRHQKHYTVKSAERNMRSNSQEGRKSFIKQNTAIHRLRKIARVEASWIRVEACRETVHDTPNQGENATKKI